MMPDRANVYFGDDCVGVIVDPWAEMFRIYGRWEPIADDALRERFLAAVRSGDGASVSVISDGFSTHGSASIDPDGFINVRSDP